MKRSPLLPIFLIVLADILGLTIILPLLPFYAEKLGASPTVVGLLVSTYAFCQLLSGPFLGRWSDRATFAFVVDDPEKARPILERR